MPNTDWHILRVETGRELHVHELLTRDKVLCYTPFETKFQTLRTKTKAGWPKRKPYAVPIWRGYVLFCAPNAITAKAVISHVESRSYIYGVMTYGERAITIGEAVRASYEHDLTHNHGKLIVGRGYDPKTDARKNNKRVYAKSQTVPTFTQGEKVTFADGPFMGLTVTVARIGEKEIFVKSDEMGMLSNMAASPFVLKKAG